MTFRGQRSRSNPKNLKSNISETVRDREMLSIEVEYEVIDSLLNGMIFFLTSDNF